MGKLLWSPSPERIEQANMTHFVGFVNRRYGLTLENYWGLYDWSVDRIAEFWAAIWDFCGITYSQNFETVADDLEKFPGAKWFPGAKLNFAENLLKRKDDHAAFVFRDERQRTATMTYRELYGQVASLAKWLRTVGLRPGDRVCAYIPNLMQTVVAMLASTSVGASWASCGAELGPTTVIDRFGQIKPKFMFTSDGYFYGNKVFNILPRAQEVASGISSVKKVIVVPYVSQEPAIEKMPEFTLYTEIVASSRDPQIEFEQLPFEHPLYIMFSSGTTGRPKCLVQGAGGVLLSHLRDLVLHSDLKEQDRIGYITTASWMMWNWLISSLAVGATILLYDGNPNYPDWGTMWKFIQDERITIFGCSATYINNQRTVGARPAKAYDLSSLREISQTGSVLSPEGFEWIYNEIKEDLHFNSISGGTDINGCFAGGSPTLPVYAGELQAPALGMKIKATSVSQNNP
jgi:acetoacetyl-CoA synthetase